MYAIKGNDITANFAPRLKHLLILLILYTEKNPNGILTSKTTGILWPDKEETAARNNRNVNLRKLRVLLESIGDVEVVTENNFMHIKWGENVFCDYREVLARIQQFKEKQRVTQPDPGTSVVWTIVAQHYSRLVG